jgi:His-Xaa-Ser system protein HxsD
MNNEEIKPFLVKDNGQLGLIKARKEFFERNCVLTVAGKYIKICWINLDSVDDQTFQLTITPKDGTIINENLLKDIMNDLIDFQIRIDLMKEFGDLRKTIVNYAFSPVDSNNV